jgi:hypothetical protein
MSQYIGNVPDLPERRMDLTVQDIDGEMVILDRGTERIHQLNASASWVWQRLDGKTSLPDLATGLAEYFDVDFETALRDVTGVTAEFSRKGLLVLRDN